MPFKVRHVRAPARGEIVHAAHLEATCKERIAQVASNKSRTTGDKDRPLGGM
jgi:hypothetical protein